MKAIMWVSGAIIGMDFYTQINVACRWENIVDAT
jgi:hypothetical protein